jgi:hypothetical protein
MNTRCLSLALVSLGFMNAASAATSFPAWTPHASQIDASGVLSDAQGAHARATGFLANAPRAVSPGGAAAWSSLGPPGGDVADVSASPTATGVVLAGVAPGGSWGGTMYRSTDDGTTWTPVPDLAGISVHDIEFAPDGTAWAATQDAVWSSDDDGATWTHHVLTGVDPLNDETFDVAIDPSDANTIWVGLTDAGGGQPVNLMRSTDSGTTWADMTPPHAAPMVGAGIAIDPGDSNTVIAVFHGDFGGGEVWVTTDGGTSWDNRSDGLPANPINAVVYDGTRLLVGGGQLFGSQYVGLWSSTDLGVTWNELDDGTWPLLVVTDIALDPNDAQTIFVSTDGAGINRTTDGGATWDIGIGGTGALAAQSIRFVPGSSTDLFSGTTSLAAFRSTDGGDTFEAASNGISELPLFSIAASPADPQQIAVAFQGNNSGGVISSTDGGATWTIEAVPPTRYSKVGFAPDGTLYAISSGPSSVAPEGLYRREADGTWTGLGPDQGDLYESDLAAMRFSSNDPNLILLGGADFGVAGNEVTVWRSTTAGASWDKVYEGEDFDFVTDIEIVEDGTDQNMVASYDGFTDPQQGGALNSVDSGATWNLALNGLPGFTRIPRLCTSPADTSTIFMSAVSSDGHGTIYHTEDGGGSWASTGWSGEQVADLACDPVDADVLYAAQSTGGPAARSDDRGVSFASYDTGLPTGVGPRALAITSDDVAPRLLMATAHGSWATPIPGGITDRIFADGFDSN